MKDLLPKTRVEFYSFVGFLVKVIFVIASLFQVYRGNLLGAIYFLLLYIVLYNLD